LEIRWEIEKGGGGEEVHGTTCHPFINQGQRGIMGNRDREASGGRKRTNDKHTFTADSSKISAMVQ